MQRFRPSSRPVTLPSKALTSLEKQRFMQPAKRKTEFRVASCVGMDSDARAALDRVIAMAGQRKICIAGRFMPDNAVSALLASHGIAEDVDEADFFRFRKVVIPYGGVSPRERRQWEEAGHPLEDMSAAQVRRAQVALGLMRMEGAQGLVIGRHDDAETQSLAGGGPGTKVIEDTTDTARLAFSPAYGVVCQSTLSPRKVQWLVQQLRFRYRDARVTFIETLCRSMALREEALEKLLAVSDRAIIVGKPGEASCEALVETALRRGKPAVVVSNAAALESEDLSGRIALTAGAFATDDAVRGVAEVLAGS
jgi:4-hydroxy-3-methylbut-2-enyl diphosphate reductase IspH